MNALRAAIVHGARRTPRRGSSVRSSRPGDGYEFAQLRGYVEGDDPRRIDWAASARTGAVQTRVYLEETALVLAAIVDESASMNVGRERRLSDAAAEALHAWFGAAENDDRVKRIIDGRIVDDRRAALHMRAQQPFALGPALELARRALPYGASLLVVCDGFDAAADETLARIARRCDATVLLARDPWHDGLPLRGFRRMRDAESGRSRLLYFGARERARFTAAVHERTSALHEQFARAGWRTGALDGIDGRASLDAAFGLR